MSAFIHQLAAVAADAGRGKYHIYFCACAAAFEDLGDLRDHIEEKRQGAVGGEK